MATIQWFLPWVQSLERKENASHRQVAVLRIDFVHGRFVTLTTTTSGALILAKLWK